MNGGDVKTKINLLNNCCVCLRQEDVRPMTEEEIDSYTLLLNETFILYMHICTICAHLLKKHKKFVAQCHSVNDILKNVIEQNCDVTLISQFQPSYNYVKSPTHVVEFAFDYDEDDKHFDDDDIPLVMFKSEEVDAVSDDRRSKKKKKRKREEKKIDIQENVKQEEVSDDLYQEEFSEGFDDNIIKEDNVSNVQKKNTLKDGFTSRMVQETREYTVIKLSKEQVLMEMASKAKTGEYMRSLFKCEKCVKGFNFEDVLRTHMERHVVKKGWLVCDICQQYCPSVVSLRGHMKSHTTRYKCKVCGCVRRSRQVLLEHHTIFHSSDSLKYSCQQCDFVSSKRTSMQRHVRTRHNKSEKHPCESCGKVLNSLEALRVHTTRHDKSKRVKCDECDRWFVYPSLLQQHKMAVHVREDYYCVECDVKFKSRENLTLHFKRNKRHRDVSTFKYGCEHCNKRFMFLSTLSGHIASAHTDHKQFVCRHCKKIFLRKSVLRTHLRTHTNEETQESTSDTKQVDIPLLPDELVQSVIKGN